MALELTAQPRIGTSGFGVIELPAEPSVRGA
jgi:hypothetical protein